MVSALEGDGRIREIQFSGEHRQNLLGNIYVGQVQRVIPNINSAFVLIQNGVTCYYPLKEETTAIYAQPYRHYKIAPGDQILVQVSREGMRGKAPSVTTRLNFTGTYLVLTTDGRQLSFSSKLVSYDKAWLRELLTPLLDRTFGIIVRTNAKDGKQKQILKEFQELKEQMDQVLEYGRSRTCFSLLYEPQPFFQKVLSNTYTEGLEEIVTDLPSLYAKLKNLEQVQRISGTCSLRLYEDPLLPLYKLYQLEKVLREATQEKIWLKSGGFLVIQQTEAFVSVDVNSGKYVGKKKAEETYRKINLEAAEEIAYQLRLRNLSGSILIDFISMENPAHEEELFHVLKKHLKKDPVRATALDYTKLKIVEATRKKVRRPLLEDLQELREIVPDFNENS